MRLRPSCCSDDPTAARTPPLWYHRPRLLYFTVFTWISITSGRFTAPFLEAESTASTNQNTTTTATLDSGQIGTILALQRLVFVVVGSFVGIWADRLELRYPNRGRILVLGGSCSLGTLVFLLHGAQRFTNSNNDIYYYFAALRILFAVVTCSVFPILDGICLDFLKKSRGQQQQYDVVPDSNSDENDTNHEKDTAEAVAKDDNDDATDDYGKERLYGAISWACTNMVLGPILDHCQGDFWAFYPLSVLSTVLVWGSIIVYLRGNNSSEVMLLRKRDSNIFLPDDDNNDSTDSSYKDNDDDDDSDDDDELIFDDDDESTNDGKREPMFFTFDECSSSTSGSVNATTNHNYLSYYLSLLAIICGTHYLAAFWVCVTTLASGQAIVNDLIFLFFEILGSSHTLLSVTVVLTVLFEIPIFQIAPKLLKRFGCDGLLVIASLAYVLRVLGYTLVPSDQPAWVLWLEPLHGITYACSQTAAVSFVATKINFGSLVRNTKKNCDNTSETNDEKTDGNDGTEATGQGFLQFFVGIGSVLGLEFGGLVQETLGPRPMYRISALVVLVGCAVFVAVVKLSRRQHHWAILKSDERDTISDEESSEKEEALEMTAARKR